MLIFLSDRCRQENSSFTNNNVYPIERLIFSFFKKGFETKDMIISNLKKNYKRLTSDESHENALLMEDDIEFEIKESDFERLKTDQITLIEKLLNEEIFRINDSKIVSSKDFRGQPNKSSAHSGHFFSSNGQSNLGSNNNNTSGLINQTSSFGGIHQGPTSTNSSASHQGNEESNKYEGRPFHDKESQPPMIDNYTSEARGNNKIQLCRFLEEGEICNKSLSNILENVLNNKESFVKIKENDVFLLKKHERAALLDMKSDQFYTDENFQKRQKEKYTQILRKIPVKNEYYFPFLTYLNKFKG